MSKILFEVSYIGSPCGFFNIVIFVGVLIIILIGSVKRKYSTNTKREYLLYKIDYIGTIFFIIIFLIIAIGLILTYEQVILGYKMGKYQEVEGVVEDYTKHPWRETFTVDNIEFETGGTAITWGYTWQNGKSVITGDGQYLRIRYIPTTNSIVYIEQLPSKAEEE